MSIVCSCNLGFGNSKNPNCESIHSVAHGLLFVNYFDSAGAINKIDLSTALDAAFWSAWIAETDETQRLRPFVSKKFQNPKLERAESVYETMDSGDVFFIQSGEKKMMALLPKTSPGVIQFLKSASCQKIGVFIVDINGNLVGNKSEIGYLRPFRVQDNSLDAKDVPATDKAVQRVELRFNFAKAEEDTDIGIIKADNIDEDLLSLEGLYDAFGVFQSPVITTIAGPAMQMVVDIRTHFGDDLLNPDRVEGLVIGDFALTNRGTGATITLTTVTENAVTNGIYTFVFPVQTSTHKLKLTFTEAGYNSDELGAQIITVP